MELLGSSFCVVQSPYCVAMRIVRQAAMKYHFFISGFND